MARVLLHGDRFSIDDPNVDLKVNLGWSSFTCFLVDVDAGAIGVDCNGDLVGTAVMGSSTLTGVKHGGDALVSGGNKEEDGETIEVSLNKVDSTVESIFFTASVFSVCPLYLPLCCIPGISSFLFTPSTHVSVSGVTNGEMMKFINASFDFDSMSWFDRFACHMMLGGLTRVTQGSDDWEFVSIGKPHYSFCCCLNAPGDMRPNAFPSLKDMRNSLSGTVRLSLQANPFSLSSHMA